MLPSAILSVVNITTILAVIQTTTVVIAVWRFRRYPALILSLLSGLPILWVPVEAYKPWVHWPHDAWQREVWLPCALVLIPTQALAHVEAFFGFGRRYRLAPRIAATISVFAVGFTIAFWEWPHGDPVSQAVQVARYCRVGSWIFIVLVAAMYASFDEVRGDLWHRTDGRHLVWMILWSTTWVVPIVRELPGTWAAWLATDWMLWARAALLVIWPAAVWLRGKPTFDGLNPLDNVIDSALNSPQSLQQ